MKSRVCRITTRLRYIATFIAALAKLLNNQTSFF